MAKPIALQLYTLRDAMAADFEGTVRKVADIGYIGVETAGFGSLSPQQAMEIFTRYGLYIAAAHIDLPLGDKRQQVLDTMATLGAKYIVKAWLPEGEFETKDQIRRHCETLNEANAVARAAGYTLVYHNHWWEYTPHGDWVPAQVMLDYLEPTVAFEIDTYWVKVGGGEPVQVIQQLGDRVPLLHIKDGPATSPQEPMLAAGEGAMSFRPIVEAGEGSAEWMIVELDRCATDMMEAVTKSYHYLTSEGLARGNN